MSIAPSGQLRDPFTFLLWRSTQALWRCCLLALLLGGSVFAVASDTVRATPAEQALAAVRALRAAGEIAPGTVLRLTAKQGNVAAFLGPEQSLQRAWEQATGIAIDVRLMPQQDSRTFITRAPPADLTIARTHELPELFHDGLIADLTPLLARFSISLPSAAPDGFLLLPQQAMLGDRVLAIPADGDVPLLYLRRDRLEDPEAQAAWQRRHGSPLRVPETWDEYQQQVAFFDRPDAGFHGALEQRDEATAWMFWIQRYVNFAENPRLFGRDMRPLLDSPAGIAATRSYVATVAHSPPGIAEPGNDYSFTMPRFVGGKGYATIITPAGGKLFGSPVSAVRDRFVAAPLPGVRRDGQLRRRGVLIYGNNLVVPAAAQNKALAVLFALWLTDPANSLRAVGIPGSFADPYRLHHLDDPGLQQLYGATTLTALRTMLDVTLPGGTGLPGNTEYLAALNAELRRAAVGLQSAEQAMQRASAAWEQITERRGRAAQRAYYETFTAPYPLMRARP